MTVLEVWKVLRLASVGSQTLVNYSVTGVLVEIKGLRPQPHYVWGI